MFSFLAYVARHQVSSERKINRRLSSHMLTLVDRKDTGCFVTQLIVLLVLWLASYCSCEVHGELCGRVSW